MTETNCGVIDHPDSCLCDVHIDKPTDIETSLQDNWVLSMVAEYMELSWPWDADKLGAIMEASAQFIDVYYSKPESERSQFLIVNERDPRQQSFFMWWKEIKSIVQHNYGLFSSPPDWRELLENSNCSLELFITALTYNKVPATEWSYERLNELQADILGGMGRDKVYAKYRLNKDGSGKWFKDLVNKKENK